MVIKLRFKANLFISINICLFVVACSTPLNISNNRTYAEHSRFISSEKQTLYGINGHSVRANRGEYVSQYNQFSIEEQIDIIDKLGVDIYRTDIYFEESGFINGPESPVKFSKLLQLAKKRDIKILPVISMYPWMKSYEDTKDPFFIGDNWNYDEIYRRLQHPNEEASSYIKKLDIWQYYFNKGFNTGEKLAIDYGDELLYYNTGNEVAYYISKMYSHPNNPIQTSTPEQNEDYFIENLGGNTLLSFFSFEEHARRTIASSAYIAGLIKGIKKFDQQSKCIITDTKINFGFYEFLNFMDIEYDIIGWNWYRGEFSSNSQEFRGLNVYEEINKVGRGKPIWITETNRFAGSRNYLGETVISAELDQSIEIYNSLINFSSLENVKAIIIYELLDQRYSFETRWEDYYGIMTAPFPDKTYSQPKDAFNTFKYTVQELKYGKQDYLYSLLTFMNENSITQKKFQHYYENLSNLEMDEKFIVNLILEENYLYNLSENLNGSKNSKKLFIQDLYKRSVRREPYNYEIRYWSQKWKNMNFQESLVDFFQSDFFIQNAIIEGYNRKYSVE